MFVVLLPFVSTTYGGDRLIRNKFIQLHIELELGGIPEYV